MSLQVRPLAANETKTFINCQWNFYRDDPRWVPPLKFDRQKLLNTAKNPFYKHAAIQLFVAERGGEIVGRIAAITNDLHNQTHKDKVGFFGFFECEDNQETADQLFAAVSAWLLERGKNVVRGPVNPSMNDECALLIEGYDLPPVVLMPYNPPYYATLIEKIGFAKAKDLLAFYISEVDYRSEKLVRMQDLIRKRYNLTIRNLDFKNKQQFTQDIKDVHAIYNKAWEDNWGFVKLTDEEFTYLAADLKQIANPEFTFFVEMDNKPIGFFLALPDINQCLIHNRGGGLLGGIWHLLTKKNKIDLVRIVIMGVLPEYRRTGADAVMYHEVGQRARDNGIKAGDASWVLEDNPEMIQAFSRAMSAKKYKTYRIYDKALS